MHADVRSVGILEAVHVHIHDVDALLLHGLLGVLVIVVGRVASAVVQHSPRREIQQETLTMIKIKLNVHISNSSKKALKFFEIHVSR